MLMNGAGITPYVYLHLPILDGAELDFFSVTVRPHELTWLIQWYFL